MAATVLVCGFLAWVYANLKASDVPLRTMTVLEVTPLKTMPDDAEYQVPKARTQSSVCESGAFPGGRNRTRGDRNTVTAACAGCGPPTGRAGP
jgi:hypothetical protein